MCTSWSVVKIESIRWNSYKTSISIKWTLLSWCLLYKDSTVASWKRRWVQPKILVVINFLSLNLTSIGIEGGWGFIVKTMYLGAGGRVLKNKQEQKRGVGAVKTREYWANVLFECPLNQHRWMLVLLLIVQLEDHSSFVGKYSFLSSCILRILKWVFSLLNFYLWTSSILSFLILAMLSLYHYTDFYRDTIGLSAELYTLLLEVK